MSEYPPQEIIDNLKAKGKTLSSIKIIQDSINRIFKNVFVGLDYDIRLLIDRSDDIITYCDSINSSTAQLTISSLVHIIPLDDYKRLYNVVFRKYRDSARDKSQYKIPSKEDIAKYIPLSSYDSIRGKFKTGDCKNLIIALYRYLPSYRGEEFFNLVISSDGDYVGAFKRLNADRIDDSIVNILDISVWKMYIGKYKTVNSYGPKITSIPIALRKIIMNWINIKGLNDGEYLLSTDKTTRLVAKAFTYHIRRAFGFGSNMLRKIYVTEMINYFGNFDKVDEIKYRKLLAKSMSHALGTQELEYSKKNLVPMNYSSKKYMDEIFALWQETIS